MKILVIGSGGREHAFALKLAESPRCSELFVAPGNAGTAQIARNVPLAVTDFPALGKLVKDEGIDMVVVGPEDPLDKGIRDYFLSDPDLSHIKFIGPGREGARLESSKDFSKEFMVRHGIPTGKAVTFTVDQIEEARRHISTLEPPVVLKADGLAAGKGVLICPTLEDAEKNLTEMLVDRKFGQASDKVLVEEFLQGIEVSVFVITDGRSFLVLPEAKDYKRIGDDDTGPNTGGMGSVSPVPFADEEFLGKVTEQVIKPTIKGLEKDGIPYTGFIFLGLMNIGGDPLVIEYNVRMGDPETQVVFPRIRNDFVDLLEAVADKKLDQIVLDLDPATAATVIMASEGYPGSYEKNKPISGFDDVNDALIYHAGTRIDETGAVATNGGRVLALTGMGQDLDQALANAYAAVEKISWEGKYYRKDIGQDIKKLYLS